MNEEQKKRVAELLTAWRATAYALHGDAMADLLQEMIAPPHQSEQHLEMVNTPAPSVPVESIVYIALNEWLDKTEWVQKELNTFPVSSLGMHRADVMRLEIERLRKLLSAAPTPAEAPADVARDAERLDWLDVQCSENNGRHIYRLPGGLRAAIDAAMSEKGGA